MFGESTSSGNAPCAEQANNGHGSTFANKFFEWNTCVYTSDRTNTAYTFTGCDVANLGATVWKTAGNSYMVPAGAVVQVPCGKKHVSLADWQAIYKQDIGATVQTVTSAAAVLDQARSLLQLATSSKSVVAKVTNASPILQEPHTKPVPLPGLLQTSPQSALRTAGAAQDVASTARPRATVNITVYHSAPVCAGASVADRNTGDITGDLYFVARSVAAPLECGRCPCFFLAFESRFGHLFNHVLSHLRSHS
jgi:hypothetical protein